MTTTSNSKIIKTIADISFCIVPLLYAAVYVMLSSAQQELGFWGMMAVILYGGLAILGFSTISLIARSVLLYQNPDFRTGQQKLLLALSALPVVAFLLKALVEELL